MICPTCRNDVEGVHTCYDAYEVAQHRIAVLQAELRSFTCVFCLTRISDNDKAGPAALREATRLHMLACKEHPMREAERERDEALAGKSIHVVFDGPPGPVCGRFVECETPDGKGVSVGKWFQRKDGYWVLEIQAALGEEVQP